MMAAQLAVNDSLNDQFYSPIAAGVDNSFGTARFLWINYKETSLRNRITFWDLPKNSKSSIDACGNNVLLL